MTQAVNDIVKTVPTRPMLTLCLRGLQVQGDGAGSVGIFSIPTGERLSRDFSLLEFDDEPG